MPSSFEWNVLQMKIKSRVHNESFEMCLKYAVINKEILYQSIRIHTGFFHYKVQNLLHIFTWQKNKKKKSIGQELEKIEQSCKFFAS